MNAKQRWAAWVERMTPADLDEEAAVRARFFVRGWALASAVALLSATMFALSGIWSQVLLTGTLFVVGPVLLWLHRRGVRFSWLGHASLLTASAVFGLGTLAQHPVDMSSVAQILLVPLLARFLLGPRQALAWLFVSIAWAGVIMVAAERGWVLDFVDPTPTLSHFVNFSIGLLLAQLFSGAFDDVRAQGMERLRELGRARNAFLANISHEIRTPMNGVLGMTELLLLEELSPAHREKLTVIQRSGHTLVALINDVLDVSKMEAGKLALEERDFSLDTVLSDVHALVSANAAKRGLRLEVHKAPDVPDWLRGDGLRLGQVLGNLMSNAVKFTATGSVRIEVTRVSGGPGVRCAFVVEDTGEGIAPEVLPRLFNAFQQADVSTTRRYGGTGLGLSLSQQLVTLMGGRIAVTSALGVGSRFSFEVGFGEAQAPTVDLTFKVLPVETRKSVLVVDDNAVNLMVATSLVEKAGFHARGVTNGRAALEEVQRGIYALVLMDCHMPEMDGFEATEHIRALASEASQVPIVALTASAMPEELAACRRVGMNDVLAKPVSFSSLRELLARRAR